MAQERVKVATDLMHRPTSNYLYRYERNYVASVIQGQESFINELKSQVENLNIQLQKLQNEIEAKGGENQELSDTHKALKLAVEQLEKTIKDAEVKLDHNKVKLNAYNQATLALVKFSDNNRQLFQQYLQNEYQIVFHSAQLKEILSNLLESLPSEDIETLQNVMANISISDKSPKKNNNH